MKKLVLLLIASITIVACNSKNKEIKEFIEGEIGKEVEILSVDENKKYLIPTYDKEQMYLDLRDISRNGDYSLYIKYREKGDVVTKREFVIYWGTKEEPYMLGSELVKEYKKLKE